MVFGWELQWRSEIAVPLRILKKYADDYYFPNALYFVDDGYSGISFPIPDCQRLTGLFDEEKSSIVIVEDRRCLEKDYLQVGKCTEMVSPAHDNRYIAISNCMDSENQVDNDMTPFK